MAVRTRRAAQKEEGGSAPSQQQQQRKGGSGAAAGAHSHSHRSPVIATVAAVVIVVVILFSFFRLVDGFPVSPLHYRPGAAAAWWCVMGLILLVSCHAVVCGRRWCAGLVSASPL